MTVPALGRRRNHDPRSLAYPARGATTHRPVTHRTYGAVLDQGQVSSCFPPGTHVRMADGSERRIENVRLGEYVLTAEGNSGRVVQLLLRDEHEEVRRLLVWGHAHLRMTSEHPVLTTRGYVPARELVPGDEVAMPRYMPESRAFIATEDYVSKPSHRLPSGNRWTGVVGRTGLSTRCAAIPEKIELDRRFGRFVGLFLAEGNCSSGTAQFSFCDDEVDTFAAEVADIARGFGCDPHIRMIPAHHGCKVSIHSTGWSLLLSALCGDGAGMKRLHPDLAAGPRDFLEGVLDGWLDGDGTHRKDGSRQGTSISRELALGMYDIGQALGKHPVIVRAAATQNRHAAMRQPRWDVTFAPGPGRCHQDETHVWRQVRYTERESYSGPVYDLTVEGDHSYVAEGVGVHNCVGNSAAHALNTRGVHRVPSPLADEAKAVAIYTAATAVDPWPGTYPEQDTGTDANSAASVLRGMGLIMSWSHAFGLDHVLAALQLGPVMLGTEWHSAMFTPDARGYGHPDGAVVGGHETLIRGDDGSGSVLVRNSWGRGWGLRGHFRLAYADLDALLQAQGDATVLTP